MGKDCYTYGEVLFGLREEFVKNRILLDELKQYITITNSHYNVRDIVLSTSLEHPALHAIRIDLIKKQKDIKLLHDFFISKSLKPQEFKDPEYFIYKNKYGKNTIRNLKGRFCYFILVNSENSKEYERLCDEILNSKIVSCPYIFEKLSDFESLNISLEGINLHCNVRPFTEKWATTALDYFPINDSIIANPFYKRERMAVLHYLFDRKIPKELIPECYREIIDKNIEKYDQLSFSKGIIVDCDLDRENELAINEDEGKIILTKKPKADKIV